MARELARAPVALRPQLPHDINAVIGALHSPELPGTAERYLRRAMYTATHHVYVGLAVVALVTLAIVLLTPRRFPVASEATGVSDGDIDRRVVDSVDGAH